MKKVLAYICAAMLLFGAVFIPQTDIYAMTTVSSADEAVEKSMDALLALLDETEIDEFHAGRPRKFTVRCVQLHG